MRRPGRRNPGRRLILTLAALASLIVGYYLGQHWQRRPLADLSAVVYPAGQAVDYPADLDLTRDPGDASPWRLIVAADTRAAACTRLLHHYALVFNRLAAWPRIQERLRLTLLAFDHPDADAISRFTAGATWAEVISADPEALNRLGEQLGISPDPNSWCSPATANAVLVAPDDRRWALIPYEQAAIMAHNIRTIIAFVE